MDGRLQLRVQRYGWDRAAGYYEGYWGEQLRPAQELLLRKASLAPGEKVLDIACGTGLVTLPAAAAVAPGGSVTGTDISQAMVDGLKALAAARGLDNLTVVRADAEAQPPAGPYDAVLCSLGLMYTPDPVASLAVSLAALRPGGRYLGAVWGARDRCGWAEIFPIVDARVTSEVCPMFFQLGTGDAFRHAMELAGFASIEISRISTILEYHSAEDAVGAAFAGGPVALAYSRFDDETRAEVEQEYLASISPYREGHVYRIPGEFVVAMGVSS